MTKTTITQPPALDMSGQPQFPVPGLRVQHGESHYSWQVYDVVAPDPCRPHIWASGHVSHPRDFSQAELDAASAKARAQGERALQMARYDFAGYIPRHITRQDLVAEGFADLDITEAVRSLISEGAIPATAAEPYHPQHVYLIRARLAGRS